MTIGYRIGETESWVGKKKKWNEEKKRKKDRDEVLRGIGGKGLTSRGRL